MTFTPFHTTPTGIRVGASLPDLCRSYETSELSVPNRATQGSCSSTDATKEVIRYVREVRPRRRCPGHRANGWIVRGCPEGDLVTVAVPTVADVQTTGNLDAEPLEHRYA